MSAVFDPRFITATQAPDARRGRGTGLAVVVGLHVLVAWALASGLARQAVEIVKKPIEMVVLQDVAPPPPPPPPPKVERIKEAPKLAPPPPAYVPPPDVAPREPVQPVIQAVQAEPPKEPVVIAPPAPPAPEPKPVVQKQDVSLACPGYESVIQQNLDEAFERVGVTGTVRALIRVRGSQITEVTPQSGPSGYYKYVQTAVKRMKCSAGGAEEVAVTLDVTFRGS